LRASGALVSWSEFSIHAVRAQYGWTRSRIVPTVWPIECATDTGWTSRSSVHNFGHSARGGSPDAARTRQFETRPGMGKQAFTTLAARDPFRRLTLTMRFSIVSLSPKPRAEDSSARSSETDATDLRPRPGAGLGARCVLRSSCREDECSIAEPGRRQTEGHELVCLRRRSQ